jgi:hypothetical protein
VLLLHDHGSKFDIGKEKLVRPWHDDTRLASAQAWADTYFKRAVHRQGAGPPRLRGARGGRSRLR